MRRRDGCEEDSGKELPSSQLMRLATRLAEPWGVVDLLAGLLLGAGKSWDGVLVGEEVTVVPHKSLAIQHDLGPAALNPVRFPARGRPGDRRRTLVVVIVLLVPVPDPLGVVYVERAVVLGVVRLVELAVFVRVGVLPAVDLVVQPLARELNGLALPISRQRRCGGEVRARGAFAPDWLGHHVRPLPLLVNHHSRSQPRHFVVQPFLVR